MHLFTFFVFVISLFVLLCACHVMAAHSSNSTNMTAKKVVIIETALEALLREHKYEVANQFISHHLDGTVRSSRFLQLVVISYLRSGRDENALDILLLGRNLYPNDEVFIYELVLFHAERGRCKEALEAWAVYKELIGGPLAKHRQERLYSYCPEDWVLKGGIISSIEHENKAHQNTSQQNIKAHEGSYLSQLCTAITGLCPVDHQFTVNRNQQPETVIAMGLSHMARRLIANHNEMQIRYRQNHHLTSPHQKSAALSLSLQKYQNPNISHGIRLGVHHRFIPSYKGSDMRRSEDLSFQVTRQTKLSHNATQQLEASYITGRNRQAGYKGYGLGLSYRWLIHQKVNLGVAVHAQKFTPAQSDLLGAYLRDGHRLSLYFQLDPDFMFTLSMSRSDTRYEKSLPYLVNPHQLTDRQQKIELIFKDTIFGQFRPYISITKHKSKSENELQSGKTRLMNFGLTASF